MTALDHELEQVAGLIDALPRTSQAALFWAASSAHLDSVDWWTAEHGEVGALLQQAQEAAYAFCMDRLPVDRAGVLLYELDQTLPEDVVAQSSWICADAALRIAVDPTFEPGRSIEYALEPVLGRTSERLFGFWQVGSGDAQEDEVAEIMAQSDVVSAIEFCRWAVRMLAAAGAPSADGLEAIRIRAADLTDS
ncbi:hypothetical protein [Kribbella sp. NPDC000426]|uniref:hypothetical protein n=1 Tax=Kribbella sp. NPDC000426 TaxID=3154255 RepID=UPI003324AB38